MKRFLKSAAVILALSVIALIVVGCGESSESSSVPEESVESGEFVNMVGPQPIESLTLLNGKIGCKMVKPEGFEFEVEKYYLIDASPKIAEYQFKIDGCDYTFRASKTSNDITGVYIDEGLLSDTVDAGSKVLPTAVSTGGFWARWFDGEMQYVLYSDNAPESTFTAVYGSLN